MNTIKTAILVAFLLTMFLCTGCNTVKGLGQDIAAVGEGAQKIVD